MSGKKLGLVGKNIGYSFSKNYFTERFRNDNVLDNSYDNFDIQDISEFPKIIENNPDLAGLNVTIPYKEIVIPSGQFIQKGHADWRHKRHSF